MPFTSSLTIWRATITCPASRRICSAVSPPVSVSRVLVSLMVSTATLHAPGPPPCACEHSRSKQPSLQKWVGCALVPDLGRRSVPWKDPGLVRARQQPLFDAAHQNLHAPAGKVDPAHAPCEEGIARQNETFVLDVECKVSRRVAWCVE